MVENLSTSAMEVDSGLKLPAYSEVENMMDDTNITLVDFMSRFEKFRVDEVSIDDAEDDICFNAKDNLHLSLTLFQTLLPLYLSLSLPPLYSPPPLPLSPPP